MQHTCYPCTIISRCRTAKRSNINREITEREREKRRQSEEEGKRERVRERDSGREMSANVGMMSGRGLPRQGEMHDGNTSHTRGACL